MMEDILVFGKWDPSKVVVNDVGLKKYIGLGPIIFPRTFGREQSKRFGKSRMNIVERLINKVGISGHRGKEHKFTSGRNVGKSVMAAILVKKAFVIIEKKTNQNPIQTLVDAVQSAAPREEITIIEYGGIRHPKAVDSSPQRRIDLALRWITQGAAQKTIRNKRKIEQALAEEIIDTAKGEKSFSNNKKNEMERQAAASR
jgi:small subunit ribosomal protein S7